MINQTMWQSRRSRIPTATRRRAGFTLLELVLVIAIMAILATIALRSLSGVEDQTRFDSTQRELADIQSAIDGDHGLRQPDGRIIPNGFVNDMGRLPASTANPVTMTAPLQELWMQPAGVTAYAIKSPPMPDQDILIGTGWHGPYLQLPFGQPSLLDGWGNAFSITPATGTIAFSIQSLGSDNAAGSTNGDPYAADVPTSPLAFLSTDYSTMVTCIVVGGLPVTAKLFQPDGNGGVMPIPGTMTSNATGAVVFTFGGPTQPANLQVSPGSRVIRLYSDAYLTPLATRYILVPKAGLPSLVINLSATTQPSTQPSN